LPFNPAQAWHWITGSGSGDVAIAAAMAEVVVHRFIRRTRRKIEAKVLDTLRMGGKGWNLSDEQVAGQQGWEPKKARSALKRLAKKGKVHQADGRWYLGGAGVGPQAPLVRG
jgi:hypothetical protein